MTNLTENETEFLQTAASMAIEEFGIESAQELVEYGVAIVKSVTAEELPADWREYKIAAVMSSLKQKKVICLSGDNDLGENIWSIHNEDLIIDLYNSTQGLA